MYPSLKQGKAVCSFVESRNLTLKGGIPRKKCIICNHQSYLKIQKRAIGATQRKLSLTVNSIGEQYGMVETGALVVFTSVLSSFFTVLVSKISLKLTDVSDEVREKQMEEKNDATREGAEGRGMPRSVNCATAEEVWEEAWEPFRGGESKYEIVGMPRKERPLLWLEAVDDKERWILLSMCLECLQMNMPKLQQTCRQEFVEIRDLLDYNREFLMQIAADASNKWLGYTPLLIKERIRKNQQTANLDEIESKLMLYGLEERALLYLNIVKIMNSWFRLTRESTGRGGGEESTLLPVNSRDVTNLRSWQIGPRDASSISEYNNPRANNGCESGDLVSIAPMVLQDMAIIVADVISCAYIQEVMDGKPSVFNQTVTRDFTSKTSSMVNNNEQIPNAPSLLELSLWPSLLTSKLNSTRGIQLFANGIYFQRLLDEFFDQVACVYEDRLPLFILSKKDGGVNLCSSKVCMRRSKELQCLSGPKYAVSLALEGLDFVLPMMRQAWTWFTVAASWFLQRAIGHAVGLVMTGIKSVGNDKKGNKNSPTTNDPVLGL
eukprot:jgi/Picsp_1/5638/NSC_02997-R1_response regulator receiver domain protein